MAEKIIFVDEQVQKLAGALAPAGKVIEFSGRKLTNNELKKHQPYALITRSTTAVNKDLLDGVDVKFVGSATTGTDHVDTDYLKSRGIYFASAPGSNANSVAEYVVYAMLKWARMIKKPLKGKTAGIIGYGNVGSIVANYCHKLGMEVLVNDPPLQAENFEFPDFIRTTVDLENLLDNADVATFHVPLTFDGEFPTANMVKRVHMDSLKNGSLFINTSRRGILDEEHLLQRLEDDDINAVIDVWENEPFFNTELAINALIATPHIAGYSYDGKLKGALAIASEYEKFSGDKVDLSIIEKENIHNDSAGDSVFADETKLFNMLKESRKLDEDHERFLSTLSLDDDERGAKFDLLRKEYPVRREIL